MEEQRQYRLALQYGRRLLQADRLRDPTYRRLMRLYALGNDRTGVARMYKTCLL